MNIDFKFCFRFLSSKRKQKRYSIIKSSITDEMKDILATNILSHVPVSNLEIIIVIKYYNRYCFISNVTGRRL